MHLQLKIMRDNARQWTLHYRSHSLTVQLRTVLLTVLATQQTAPTEQSNYCYMCGLRTGRAIHLASPVINEKVEGNYIPHMPGLKERRELSMSKFIL